MASCFMLDDSDSQSTAQFVQFENRDEDGRQQRKRQCTDVFFIYFFGAFLAVTLSFFIYCGSIGDVNRIINGYDECGNVCGVPNKRSGSDLGCVGLDMTNNPYLKKIGDDKHCVSHCGDEFDTIFGRCVAKNSSGFRTVKPIWQYFIEDINASKYEILYMSVISFGLVALIVMLLRYNTEPFIWAILIGGSVALILLCIGLWVIQAKASTSELQFTYMSLAIGFSIITFVLLLILGIMFKRIKMVISLFKEASKALGAIPHLMLEPIITIAVFFISFVVMVYGGMLIGSAGNLTMLSKGHYEYVSNKAVIFSGVLFEVGWIWMLYFFVGCQSMIVAGTISSWYFIRDKSRLASPILYSTYNLLRYHLGTVAFGSLIMLIMQLVRMVIESLKRAARENGCGLCLLCCSCIFGVIEEIVRYFSRLAFIVTAMHGVPFCQGGKNAMRMLVNNGIATIAFNGVSSFILFFINLIIMMTTMLVAYYIMDKPGLNSVWCPVVASTLIACFMAYCVLSVYDTALDTLYLCFCEDSEINDGLSRPYYMSADLMLFVENSKKALEQLEMEKEAKKNRNTRNAPAIPA